MKTNLFLHALITMFAISEVNAAESESSLVVRRVWSDAPDLGGSVSPDGRLLSFVDWDTGDLALRDLAASQNRRLTDKGAWEKSSEFAEESVFAPDGKRLAYSWFDGQRQYELRTMSLDDSTPQVLLNGSWVTPSSWSPDGKTIAAVNWNTNRYDVVLAAADGSSTRTVKSFDNLWPAEIQFSPDSQYLAYSIPVEQRNREHDIFLIDLATNAEVPIVKHPADDRLLGWANESGGLLFSSDRRRSTDIWLVPMSSGKPSGEPVLLKTDFGDASPMGITSSGILYYGVSSRATDLYSVEIDFQTGKILSPAKEVPSRYNNGQRNRSSLSPDGRHLYFEQQQRTRRTVYIHNLETAEMQEYPSLPNLTAAISPIWSADNRYLAFRGPTRTGRNESRNTLYVLNRMTGENSIICTAEPQSQTAYWGLGFQQDKLRYFRWEGQKLLWISHDLTTRDNRELEIGNLPHSDAANQFTLSPDDKHLFYCRSLRTDSATNWFAIRRELATGNEIELLQSTNQLAFLGDPMVGRPIFITQNLPRGGVRTVTILDVADNSVKERFTIQIPGQPRFAPTILAGNNRHILFTQRVRGGTEPTIELWIASSETGEKKKTDITVPRNLGIIAAHGDHKVYFQKMGPELSEVWAMEGFIPSPTAAK